MASYYGYVKRDADSYMNWGKVADTLSDTLAKEVEAREKKKAELDEAADVLETKIKDVPVGKVDYINTNSMKLAEKSTEAVQSWVKDLKAGKLSPYEYKRRLQRLEDEVKLNYNIAKANGEVGGKVLDRSAKGISSQFELWQYQQFMNQLTFQNTYPLVDKENGTIYQAKMEQYTDENGNVRYKEWQTAPPTDHIQSLNGMRIPLESEYDAFDYQKSVAGIVKMFGEQTVVKDIKKATNNSYGELAKIMDPRNRQTLPDELRQGVDNYNAALESYVKAAATPMNCVDMLMSKIPSENGQLYTPTTDPKEAANDPTKILIEYVGQTPVPKFDTENGKKQYDKVIEFMKSAVNSGLKYEETRIQTDALPDPNRSRGGGGGGGALNPPGSKPKETPPTEGGVDIVAMRNDARKKISLRNINKNDPEQTANALSPYFNSLGISVEGQSSGGIAGFGKTRKIRLKLPNGTNTEWIVIDDANQSTIDALVGYVENADPKLAAKAYPKK